MGKTNNKTTTTTTTTTNTDRFVSSTYCEHDGTQTVFTIRGVTVLGAADRHLEADSTCLLLNCSNFTRDAIAPLPEGFESLSQFMLEPTTISLDWPDGGRPNVSPEFWKQLPRLAKVQGYPFLIPYCVGSHGRTGTALSAMAIVNKRLSVYQAVELVRKKHCHKAVETSAQVAYLEEVEKWAKAHGGKIKHDNRIVIPSYHHRPAVVDPVSKKGPSVGASLTTYSDDLEDDSGKPKSWNDDRFNFGNY